MAEMLQILLAKYCTSVRQKYHFNIPYVIEIE